MKNYCFKQVSGEFNYRRFSQDSGSNRNVVKKVFLIILFFAIQSRCTFASDTLPIFTLDKVERIESLNPFMTIYLSYDLNEDAGMVLNQGKFTPLKSFSFKRFDLSDKVVFWQKFSLLNDCKTDSVFYMFNKYYNYWNLYEIIENVPVFVASAGRRAPFKERNDSSYFFSSKVVIPVGARKDYLMKYQHGFYEMGIGLQIATQKHHEHGFYPDFIKREVGELNVISLIFAGIFIVFSIYSFLLFVQTRKNVYLYYAIFQVLIFFPLASKVLSIAFLDSYNAPVLTFISLLQVVSYYFYFLFVEHFLKVKVYSPLISKILFIGRIVVLIYIVVVSLAYFSVSTSVVGIIFSIGRGLMLLIGFTAITLSFFKTIPLSGYVAAGSLSLAIFALASWLSTTPVLYHWNKYPLMEVGILIELMCFTLGLGAFTRREEQQRINLQADLIESLQENKLLQEESIKAIVETQETERTRIGRDLHDDVGAQLSTLKLFLNSLKSGTRQELLEYSTSILDSAIHDIRTILINLSPKVLDEYGYVKAVEEMVSKINSSNVLKFELSVHGLDQRLDSKLENSLYRITQELINNSLKYSWAKHIILDVLRRDDRIVLMYEDNGRGCDIQDSTRGFGLTNIRTRVKMFNGQVYFDSSPGNGFRCEIELDIKA